MKWRISLVLLVLLIILSGCYFWKPKVLIIGDSISIEYTHYVKEYFNGEARIMHNPGNAQHTGVGLDKLKDWLDDKEWDIIIFNWGLWDLYHREQYRNEKKNQPIPSRKITCTLDEYTSNLDSIAGILKMTQAKLMFVTTTYVPENAVGRFTTDVIKYNEAAKKIMKKHSIIVIDIYEPSRSIHEKFRKSLTDVHYTNEGYQKLSELIINNIEPKIELMNTE